MSRWATCTSISRAWGLTWREGSGHGRWDPSCGPCYRRFAFGTDFCAGNHVRMVRVFFQLAAAIVEIVAAGLRYAGKLALSARLRGERARAGRAGEVGGAAGKIGAAEAHLTLPLLRSG